MVIVNVTREIEKLSLRLAFAFYYNILADITSPTMLAVFVRITIARAPAVKVGVESSKLVISGYMLPSVLSHIVGVMC